MTTAEQAQIASALQLDGAATPAEILARATGLVAALTDLRSRVYVGIIDSALADHDIVWGE